jgi:mannose-6-phosphate isomerase-like protein (cupin superfamily)
MPYLADMACLNLNQNKIMNTIYNYNINLDVKYQHQELIDVNNIVEENKEKWFNQTLTQVNNSIVRLGIVEGEFHWHKHNEDDEFFFVLEGNLIIELEDKKIELKANQGVTISKGVMHRPVAPVKTVMLMVETKEVVPTGE